MTGFEQISSMISSGQVVSLLIAVVAVYVIIKAVGMALKVCGSVIALFSTLYFINPHFYQIASDMLLSLIQSGGALANSLMG